MDSNKIITVVHFQVTLSFSGVVEISKYGACEMTIAKATKMSKDVSARSAGPAYTVLFLFLCIFRILRLLNEVLSRKSLHDANYRFCLLISITVQAGLICRQSIQFALQTTRNNCFIKLVLITCIQGKSLTFLAAFLNCIWEP